MTVRARFTVALSTLLAAAIVKLWLLPLPSSFWVDEMVTAFVVHQGAEHPSLKVAPQVTATIYYWLPWVSEKLFGFSEISYRFPSLLMMGAALFFVARLAMRLIHPEAGWFAVFAALTLRGINYEAANARPYALALFIAAAALWFLVRWLDSARWYDAAAFVLFAALLWRVHLINWPFYVVFAAYPLARLWRRGTPVLWRQAAVTFAILAAALIPVLLDALALMQNAEAHVITKPPSLREFGNAFKFLLIAGCAAGGWLLSRKYQWPRQANPSAPALVLILGWWMWHPVSLYAFSWITGNSVFVPRYLSLSLPGAALAGVFRSRRILAPCDSGLRRGCAHFRGRQSPSVSAPSQFRLARGVAQDSGTWHRCGNAGGLPQSVH
jgi:mannosyltransferase